MSQDPYAPPTSPLNGPTPSQLADTGLKYSTFWSRVGAGLIDFIFISPLLAVNYFMGDSAATHLYLILVTQLVTAFLYVYMVAKFGGTPGKLALGLRVAMLDGAPVNVKAACLRYGIWWTLGLISGIGMAIAATSIAPETLSSGYMARTMAMSEVMPGWAVAASYGTQLFALASIIAMLVNDQRRTLHDFVAGTVVVRKS